MAEIAAGFQCVADRFREWFDAAVEANETSLQELHALLAELQRAACALPDLAPDSDAIDDAISAAQSKHFSAPLPFSDYALVFNPLDEGEREICFGSIRNDLDEIYEDLESGLTALHKGPSRCDFGMAL